MPRILGIDSSLTSSGLCRVDILGGDVTIPPAIDVWRVTSKPGPDRSAVAMSDRITQIITSMEPHVAKSDLVTLEGISFASSGTGAHALHWLWGRIVDLTTAYAVELLVVPPSLRMKYATGKGNANKDAVLAATIRRFPNVDVTGNDVADATILAAIGCRHLGLPIDDMPRANWETVMTKVGR
jgi:Holliday junction resolvasome RuvABC endonuclease subunit